VLLILLLLRVHLLILLRQRVATTEAGARAVAAAMALDTILVAHTAAADHLADTLKRAKSRAR